MAILSTPGVEHIQTTTTQQIRAALLAQFQPRTYPAPFDGAGDALIAVVLLDDATIDNARLEAARYTKKRNADLTADPDFLEREVQRQIVYHAIRHPTALDEKGRPVRLFMSDEEVRELPASAVEALFNVYLEHIERMTPTLRLDDAALDRVIDDVRKGGPVAVSALDHGTLVKVAVAMAARLAKDGKADPVTP